MRTKKVAALVLFDLAALLVFAALVVLAVWQLHRREWKLDLIARVEARVHAPAAPAPGPERWAGVSAAADEYRRVSITGTWLQSRPALVRAVTARGGGYWVMAPLLRDDGTAVFVNRGFVPADQTDPGSWRPLPNLPQTVTGLLRLSEPRGSLLRANDPNADRWRSRDVAAIAAARGLNTAAPYFIDAEAVSGEEGLPIGGMTVLSFSNNHLTYALTWSALALMAAGGAAIVNVDILRNLRRSREAGKRSRHA